MAKWDRAVVQAAEQTAHPSAVRAGGRVTPLRRYPGCIHIGEQPEIGTLVVDLFDGNSKKAIWRGTSSTTFSGNPQKDAKNLNKALAKMFRNFPPTTKAKPGVLGWMLECVVKGVFGPAR